MNSEQCLNYNRSIDILSFDCNTNGPMLPMPTPTSGVDVYRSVVRCTAHTQIDDSIEMGMNAIENNSIWSAFYCYCLLPFFEYMHSTVRRLHLKRKICSHSRTTFPLTDGSYHIVSNPFVICHFPVSYFLLHFFVFVSSMEFLSWAWHRMQNNCAGETERKSETADVN